MKLSVSLLLLLLCALPVGRVWALQAEASFGIGTGGQNLSEITEASGRQDFDLPAGSLVFLSLGMIQPVTLTVPHRFEVQLNFGYLYSSQKGPRDGDLVTWMRWPIELLYSYRNSIAGYRFAYGPTLHIWNRLEGEGGMGRVASDFDPAWGATVVFEKFLSKSTSGSQPVLGLKYNRIRYHSDRYAKDVNGDGVFLTLSCLYGSD